MHQRTEFSLFYVTKKHLKMSSTTYRPYFTGVDMLMDFKGSAVLHDLIHEGYWSMVLFTTSRWTDIFVRICFLRPMIFGLLPHIHRLQSWQAVRHFSNRNTCPVMKTLQPDLASSRPHEISWYEILLVCEWMPCVSIHQGIRHHIVGSRKISKPRDIGFALCDRFQIWQAARQHSCRDAC